jgi:hypothetical protein
MRNDCIENFHEQNQICFSFPLKNNFSKMKKAIKTSAKVYYKATFNGARKGPIRN